MKPPAISTHQTQLSALFGGCSHFLSAPPLRSRPRSDSRAEDANLHELTREKRIRLAMEVFDTFFNDMRGMHRDTFTYIYLCVHACKHIMHVIYEQLRKLQCSAKDISKFGKVPSFTTTLYKKMHGFFPRYSIANTHFRSKYKSNIKQSWFKCGMCCALSTCSCYPKPSHNRTRYNMQSHAYVNPLSVPLWSYAPQSVTIVESCYAIYDGCGSTSVYPCRVSGSFKFPNYSWVVGIAPQGRIHRGKPLSAIISHNWFERHYYLPTT